MLQSRRHVLAFAVTPVQLFIREARKAQDLWSASLLLSQMTLAGLKALPSGCQIIYPHVPTSQEYVEWARPRVTNEALVVLPDSTPEQAAQWAELTANKVRTGWLDVAEDTRRRLVDSGLLSESQLLGWTEQVAAQFEVAWAVTPLGEDAMASVQTVQSLLGGAKRCRRIASFLGDARPKCTLCGQWEQMGPIPERDDQAMQRARAFWEKDFRKQLRRAIHDRPLQWAVVARVELDGRERLCAVSLVKRLAPVLTLANALNIKDPGKDEAFPGRFPSTTSIAWVEQKERLLQIARLRPTVFGPRLEQFNRAVEYYAETFGVPRGKHRLRCHDELLANLPDQLRNAAPTFLRLDGDWLGDPEREAEESNRVVGFNEPDSETSQRAREQLRNAHRALKDALEGQERQRVRLGRTPPVALLRADADKLGETLERAMADGMDRATALSAALSGTALQQAVARLELDCRGRVVFDGGDELLALVPAVHALDAAEFVANAYEEAGRELNLPLTCSVAVVVVDARSPLRGGIEELGILLDSAKDYERIDPLHGKRSRHGFGLAVIPGSGQIKRGVAGLLATRFDGREGAWRLLPDVLRPLADALRLPSECGLSISPKLYREWLDCFEPEADEEGNEFLDAKLLPEPDAEGIALTELRRLAQRRVDVGDARRFREIQAVEPWLARWSDAVFGPDGLPTGKDAVRAAVVEALVARVRSILCSPTVVNERIRHAAPWSSVRGLLLGVTALATREAR